jgi:hypothetical protein
MSYERKLGKWWLSCGVSFNQVSLGFSISKYMLSIDLVFIWIGIEF